LPDVSGRRNPEAAVRAGQVIATRLLALQTTPDIGRPFDGEEGLRELVIGFGSSGYVALYRHDLPMMPSMSLPFVTSAKPDTPDCSLVPVRAPPSPWMAETTPKRLPALCRPEIASCTP
jgi:hypothetical protein